MNTNNLVVFLPALLAGSVGLVLFIIAGSSILNAFKTRSWVRIAQIRPNEVQFRRKRPVNPNIICMLPMHEEKRPDQKLW